MNFTAIDFETANSRRNSPCAIGIVLIENGKEVNKIKYLIKPPNNHFNPNNIRVHGITPEMTENENEFDVIWNDIKPYIENQTVIAYNGNNMDFKVLEKTLEYYNIDFNSDNYNGVDILRLTKNLFSHLKDYKLTTIADLLGIKFDISESHDPLCDAVLLSKVACKIYNLFDINEEFEINYNKPIVKKKQTKNYSENDISVFNSKKISSEFRVKNENVSNSNNIFYNKKVVITGVFQKFPNRNDLAKLIHEAGAEINSSISKKTDIVVVGENAGPKKLETIKELNIKVLSEIELLNNLPND